jgi:hypothetical protein
MVGNDRIGVYTKRDKMTSSGGAFGFLPLGSGFLGRVKQSFPRKNLTNQKNQTILTYQKNRKPCGTR